MNINHVLNEVLVRLFRNINVIEERAICTGDYKDVTANDMHVIEAIGVAGPQTSSAVARRLSVTVGTLTKAIDRLTRNSYVLRERSDEDKRLVLLSLTEKGDRAYFHHQNFHKEMVRSALDGFSDKETGILVKSLGGLVDYFRGIERKKGKA